MKERKRERERERERKIERVKEREREKERGGILLEMNIVLSQTVKIYTYLKSFCQHV